MERDGSRRVVSRRVHASFLCAPWRVAPRWSSLHRVAPPRAVPRLAVPRSAESHRLASRRVASRR
eukprot:8323975-Lingulodinium_polyedra.AAC.1